MSLLSGTGKILEFEHTNPQTCNFLAFPDGNLTLALFTVNHIRFIFLSAHFHVLTEPQPLNFDKSFKTSTQISPYWFPEHPIKNNIVSFHLSPPYLSYSSLYFSILLITI